MQTILESPRRKVFIVTPTKTATSSSSSSLSNSILSNSSYSSPVVASPPIKQDPIVSSHGDGWYDVGKLPSYVDNPYHSLSIPIVKPQTQRMSRNNIGQGQGKSKEDDSNRSRSLTIRDPSTSTFQRILDSVLCCFKRRQDNSLVVVGDTVN